MVEDESRATHLQPDWFDRGHATATIIFNDPVWSQQRYAMDRRERTRHDHDPPIPAGFVHDLIQRRRQLIKLQNQLLAAGLPSLPADADPAAWSTIPDDGGSSLSREASRSSLRFVPRALLDAYLSLRAVPLPGSADARDSAAVPALMPR